MPESTPISDVNKAVNCDLFTFDAYVITSGIFQLLRKTRELRPPGDKA